MKTSFPLIATAIVLALFSLFFMATSKEMPPINPKYYETIDSLQRYPGVLYAFIHETKDSTYIYTNRPATIPLTPFADSICGTLRHFNYTNMRMFILRGNNSLNSPIYDTIFRRSCY
jgi:hypothetical protein